MKLRYSLFGLQGAARCGALVFCLSGLAVLAAETPALEATEDAATPEVPAVAADARVTLPTAQAPGGVIPAVIPAVTPGPPAPVDPSLPAAPAPVGPSLPAVPELAPAMPMDPYAPVEPVEPVDNGDFENPISMAGTPAEGVARIGEMPEDAVGYNVQPSGFSGTSMDMAHINRLLRPMREGFSASASLSATYDSNPRQGYGGGSNDADMFATLGGMIGYHTTASELTFGISYSGSYSAYADQTNLNAYNQGAQAWAKYEGGPLSVNLNVGLTTNDSANRYYGAVVKQTSINYGLSGRYRLSDKTVLTGNVGQHFTQASGGYTDTTSLTAGLSVLWRYSERTEFGPGVRYTADSGMSDNFRTSFGPTVTCNYKLSGKISLNSQLGLDFIDYEAGGDDTMVSAMIGLNYRASELWGMTMSFYRGGQAAPTLDNGTMEVNNFSLSYYRKIQRGVWTLGMTYETTSRGTVTNPNGMSDDSDYFGVFTGYSMPVFKDTCNLSTNLNWSENSGGTTNGTGSFQATIGISRTF